MLRNEIIRNEGVIYSGQWEPIYFQKQNGGNNRENLDSAYDFKRTEEYAKYLASIGVNHMWGNFFKGYGLAFEDAEQQRLGPFIEACHKHGLRYIGYITFGTLALETLLPEQPNAEDWIAKPDVFFRAAYSGYQNFRARVCYSSDEYIDYLIKVVDKALDLGADGIHFDNAEMAIGFEACRCQRCQTKFRGWLTERYGHGSDATRDAGQARYAMNQFELANAPWFTLGQHPVNQRQVQVPHQQDWVQFRCDTFAAAARRLAEHIKRRGRLVEFNFGKNDNGNNQYYRGLDYDRVFPLVDLSFHEDLTPTGFNAHGTPTCAIRAMKIAQSYGTPLMIYCRSEVEQAMAYALNPGMIGVAIPGQDDKRQKMFDFFRANLGYNSQTESLANVAVLRHRLSEAFDSYGPYMDTSAVEQVLQENHIPFNILAARHLDGLGQYKLLIIAGMRYMTDAEIETISAWVKAGGRLLLVGDVAVKNELNQYRCAVKHVSTIEDLLREDERKPGFTDLAGRAMDAMFIVDAGKGKVGYIPKVEHIDVPGGDIATWRVEAVNVNAPHNGADILGAINALLDGDQPIRVVAPRDVVAEFCRRQDTGEGVIHLVNIGHIQDRSASADVWFRWNTSVKSVRCLRYDQDTQTLPVKTKDGWCKIRVEDIREHVVIVV